MSLRQGRNACKSPIEHKQRYPYLIFLCSEVLPLHIYLFRLTEGFSRMHIRQSDEAVAPAWPQALVFNIGYRYSPVSTLATKPLACHAARKVAKVKLLINILSYSYHGCCASSSMKIFERPSRVRWI